MNTNKRPLQENMTGYDASVPLFELTTSLLAEIGQTQEGSDQGIIPEEETFQSSIERRD